MQDQITTTAACEVGNCHRCRGTVLSLSEAHGRPCAHECHQADDRAVKDRLEADHFGEVE
jgi:hypothetical protein